jgi:hypothetical protein
MNMKMKMNKKMKMHMDMDMDTWAPPRTWTRSQGMDIDIGVERHINFEIGFRSLQYFVTVSPQFHLGVRSISQAYYMYSAAYGSSMLNTGTVGGTNKTKLD